MVEHCYPVESGSANWSGKYRSKKASEVRSAPGMIPMLSIVTRPTTLESSEIAWMIELLPVRFGYAFTPADTPSMYSIEASIVNICQLELAILALKNEGLVSP